MIRRRYVCTIHNDNWKIGQYFIVDEDREFCVTARPVRHNQRGVFTLEQTSLIEMPFDESIRPYVREIGANVEEQSGEDDYDDNSIII